MTGLANRPGPSSATASQEPLVLDGRHVAAEMRRECADEVQELAARYRILPGLAVVRVGKDPASVQYAERIVKSFGSVGLEAAIFELPSNASRAMLRAELEHLNALPQFAAVMVQWPLPPHLGWDAILDVLDPSKDVDGSHPMNIGRLALGLDCYVPATPAGGVALLDYYNIPIEGKHALVIGRSSVVGRPLAQLLLGRNATVTVAHSRTRELPELIGQADILGVAAGKPGLVNGHMLKQGAVVLDFGASFIDGRMTGDVDYDSALARAGAITPVPGGTGPMTNVMLIRNTLRAIRKSLSAMGYRVDQKRKSNDDRQLKLEL